MASFEIGQLVDRYRIDAVLGRGGMGEVYRAHDSVLRRDVALKVVRVDDVTSGDGSLTEVQRSRLLREARAAAALKHPSIVTIYDVGELGETPYIAMELVEGRSLRAFLRAEGITVLRKLRWLCDAASALAAAHRARLVHRDVKPDNVMVCDDDSIKVLDFGIAKVHAEGSPASAGGDARGVPSQRTATGAVIGTPRYMSPEQSDGRPIDARSDQFSWGVVAFELLAGFHPRDACAGFSVRGGWSEPAPSLAGADLPEGVADAILRTLERAPSERFASMEDVVAVLAPFASRPLVATSTSTAPPRAASIDREADTRASPPTLGSVPSPHDTNETPAPSAKPAVAPNPRRPWLFGLTFGVGGVLAALVFGNWLRTPDKTLATAPSPSVNESAEPPPPHVLATTVVSSSAPPEVALPPSAPLALSATPSARVESTAPATHAKVTLVMRVLTHSPYPEAVVLGALAPTLKGLQSCLQASLATDEELRRTASLTIQHGAFLPKVTTACRAEPMCKCMRAHAPSTLPLPPTPNDHGAFSVGVLLQP